jgi:pimeloyl-ACP methyl ester carboxylesterase
VVVIPGNPGDAAFYQRFVDELRERGHEVLLSEHPALVDSPASLLPYARHQADETRRHLLSTGRAPEETPVVLVGHSVGAYLAYLIVAHGLVPVARVFMLFPFLMRPAWSGRVILAAASSRWLARVVLAAFRALPVRVRRWLVGRAGAGEQAAHVLGVLGDDHALGYSTMARVEQTEIAERTDASYLAAHPVFRGRATFVPMFCARDRWAPPALVRELAPFAHHLPPQVSHGFVVHPGERTIVAEVLHDFLSGVDLRGEQPRARVADQPGAAS